MVARMRSKNHRGHMKWSDLKRRQRAAILVLASIEFSLTATAAVDLFNRPQELLRGAKALWWPVLAIQPFGPIAYLALARKPPAS